MESSLCCSLFIFVMIGLYPFAFGNSCPRNILPLTGGTIAFTNMYDHGSVMKYQCDKDYYPHPVKIRRCLYGKWDPEPSKKPPECRKVTCPNPNVLESGMVTPYKRVYFVNDTTTYKCHSSYNFRGSSTRVCQANGKWSGGTPICSRDSDHCPDPGVPPGGSRSGNNFKIDDEVTYNCDNKLKLVGSKVRVCRDDKQWSGTEPACYADFTYDTPEEVSEAFGSSLKTSLVMYEEIENVNGSIQHGKKIRTDAGGKLDIYIALDASDSIEEEQFEDAKAIITKLIQKISDYEVTPNYEILIFASDVCNISLIRDSKGNNKISLEAILQKLEDFKYDAKGDKTGTNIAKAYQKILDSISFEKERDKTFNDIYHVIIMFTDGIANMGGNPRRYIEEIKDKVYGNDDKREDHLDLYVFGVGDDVKLEDVDGWVSKRQHEKHFFLLQDHEALKEALDEMIDEGTKVGLCGLYKDYDDGEDTTIRRRYPWFIRIEVTHSNGKKSKCLGSLVTREFVLTAAHCFKLDDETSNIYLTTPFAKEHLKVDDFILHPKYKLKGKESEGISEYYEYDVALIQLQKGQIKSFTAELRPICIPCTQETSGALKLPSIGVTCQHHREKVMTTDFVKAHFMSGGNKGQKYEKKDVEIKQEDKREACITDAQKALGISEELTRTLTENFLCTGGTEHTVDDNTCKGDSGGATFVEQSRVVQVGIVSWGLEDLCSKSKSKRESARDFHIDLFVPDVQDFLKQYLGNGEYGAPLTFL